MQDRRDLGDLSYSLQQKSGLIVETRFLLKARAKASHVLSFKAEHYKVDVKLSC